MDYFNILLDSHVMNIRQEVCWAISNLCANSEEVIEKVLQNQKLMKKLLHLVEEDM